MCLENFFKQVGNAKINGHANKAGHAKSHELEYKILDVETFHGAKIKKESGQLTVVS